MKYVIGLLIFVALVGAGFVGMKTQTTPAPQTDTIARERGAPSGAEHRVVLTSDGFTPAELTIAVGDTVVFSADETYGALYWPASNIHPTHRLYAAFDPKKPIDPGDTWRFTFTKEGTWRFHDHLAPYYTGVITVQ